MNWIVEGVQPEAIPKYARAIELVGQPPSKYRFLDLQKTAWQHHCLVEIAYRLGQESVDIAEAETFINERLKALVADGSIDLQGDDSPIKLCFDQNGVPHDTLIYKVESAVAGTAEAFYEGPAGSLLWLALSGSDHSEKAVERFLQLTGFYQRDLIELPTEFWEDFSNCFFELSLLTLSSFVSQLFFESRKLLKRQTKYKAAHLMPHIYMNLFKHPDDSNLKLWAFGLSDEEMDEVASVAEKLSSEPSYHRAFRVSRSRAVAEMLAVFGLHYDLLMTATGKPRLKPSIRKNAVADKKLTLPRRGFPREHFFKALLPSLQDKPTDKAQWPVRYGQPSIWLPTGEPLSTVCRRQWLATGSLLDIWN